MCVCVGAHVCGSQILRKPNISEKTRQTSCTRIERVFSSGHCQGYALLVLLLIFNIFTLRPFTLTLRQKFFHRSVVDMTAKKSAL